MSMRDGICPECGSTEIYIRSGWFNNIIVMFMPPKTQVHVCGNCGYVAEFIDKGLPLNHVKKNWQLVRSRKRPPRPPMLLRGKGNKTLPKKQPPSRSSRWS